MKQRMIPEHFLRDGRPKKKYLVEQEAVAAAKIQQEGSGSKRRPYHHYFCSFCSGWHVGRKPPKGKRL